MITYRLALRAELAQLKTFLFEHGPNPWNHLPVDGIDYEFDLIAQEKASALMTVDGDKLVGFAIFYHPKTLPEKYLQYSGSESAVYIAEVLVQRRCRSQGIGHNLLSLIIDRAPDLGASMLLIDRHEENLASAGMMRKAGFVELSTYLDLDRRDYGSRKTTVMGYRL
ncbi:MAG: GNAT family N-acetyltransferase [Porticoccaceae bacterium]|jgi:GNAT superfamily N-acetyltransferase|nr:GNAT family N-acetyltransferase [Porticoccaceae bacterium]